MGGCQCGAFVFGKPKNMQGRGGRSLINFGESYEIIKCTPPPPFGVRGDVVEL